MFQGKITIKKGIIETTEHLPGRVVLDFGSAKHIYNDCWAMPSFVDSHIHLLGLGEKVLIPNLEKAQSDGECISILNSSNYQRGGWIYGRGWNQENFTNKVLPHKNILDKYFSRIPVFLLRIDGHCAWVNSEALRLAKISRFTPSPKGGLIMQDKSGNPTGVLLDSAMEPVSRLIPDYSDNEILNMHSKAIIECHKNGITEIHDMDVDDRAIKSLQRLDSTNNLNIRYNAYIKAQNGEWLNTFKKPHTNDNIKIIGLKFFLDGALGSYGALMINGYKDKPGYYGLELINIDELYKYVRSGINTGFQIAIHAIGDAANNAAMNLVEKLYLEGIKEYIIRIEHAQIIKPEDVKRMADLGIIALVQPIHYTGDAIMAEKKLHRNDLNNAYRWKSLINAGIRLIAGSDAPVESINPFYGLDSFINKSSKKHNWHDKEIITLNDALESYVVNPRKITGSFSYSGSLEKNKRADLIIVDKNIKVHKLKNVNIKATYFDGELVFKSEE